MKKFTCLENLFGLYGRVWSADTVCFWRKISLDMHLYYSRWIFISSRPEVFLRKGVLKICSSKFTGEHPYQSAISLKLQSKFIEIAIRHGCSPVNLLDIFRTPFPRNTSGWLLLKFQTTFWIEWIRYELVGTNPFKIKICKLYTKLFCQVDLKLSHHHRLGWIR